MDSGEKVGGWRTESPHQDGSAWGPLNVRDLDLIRGVLQRRARAVDAILHRLRLIPRVLRVQNARHGSPLNEHDIDDLAQDVFVVIWRKLADYNGRKPLEAWAYRICRYEFLNGIRRSGRRTMTETHPGLPDRASVSPLDFDEVHRGLETLPADESVVVQLKHFEDLTFEEVGKRLAISANTAKTRYYRGMTRLEAFLEEREREPSREC